MSDEKTTLININLNDFKNERRASCIIIEGEQIGRVFNLTKQKNIIGRIAEADIHLNSPTVSRKHAEIIIDDNSIFINDLNSSNGTYVNGKKVTKTELHEGDIFSIGTYKLKLISLSEHDTEFFRRLKENAEKDALTGLYNKASIINMLTAMLDEAKHSNRYISIAMLDIDLFKKINDIYGHLAGDSALKDIATLLISQLRSTDRLGRFGGEEFLIIFKDTPIHDAGIISERLRKTIAGSYITYGGKRINVTVSIGLACNKNETEEINDAESLIKIADEKLYIAKGKGRNIVVA
ncbi:MAG: diguanylate cyclase [bacterium]